MAQRYYCPVCGASHKDLPEKCRLCGQMMGPDAVVGEPQQSRKVEERSAGLGGIIVAVVLLVIALIAAFVIFGLVPGNKTIESAKGKIGLTQTADGWSRFENPAGGYSVELPEGERRTDNTNGSYTVSMLIGTETFIQVTATRIMSSKEYVDLTKTTEADQTAEKRRFIADEADTVEREIKADGGKIDKRDNEITVLGEPAVYYEVRNVKVPNDSLRKETLYARRALVVKDGVLYDISVTSVYRDASQFDRVLNSLVVTGPPGGSSNTSSAQ